jgi:hypothetical protein
MRYIERVVGIVLLVTFLAPACQRRAAAAKQFPDYPHVVAGPDCPPAGRHAVTLVFRQQPDSFDAIGRQLRVAIWRDVRSLSRKTFDHTDRPSTGGGYECADATSCSPLLAWRVRFDGIGPDTSLTGELEVRGAKEPTRRGYFRAIWRPRVVYCI